ncbi:hypothetical protein ACFSDD_10860 [Salipiger marinus]|uniref:hypothetical protein n=1 Tax=Salipiger marinus TaxID=555512 RepID=UPI002C22802F|nr:hypothetical protein [Salipiger manganoxidans]MEB3420226.1 hypothetical protein [Salipiger manganoxidans]
MDGLHPQRSLPNTWKKLAERDRQQETVGINLSNFSFLDHPEETLTSIKEIAIAEAHALSARLNFKDKNCLDVAPFMTLMEFWSDMVPIFEGGEMDFPMQKVLAATGVSQAMGIGLGGVSDFDDVWAFPLTRRRRPGSTVSRTRFVDVPTRDTATTRFCTAMNDWLGQPDISLELSDSGAAKLMNLLGEVLENAERHSDGARRDGAWSVSGFLTRDSSDLEGEWKYRASIGIISVGNTFSESLSRAHPNQLEKIDEYVKAARRDGARQSDETLRTVCALQDTVTCVSEAEEESRGGYGLMDILDFVDGLGQTDDPALLPRVTIISGRSCIRLFGSYISGKEVPGEVHSPRVQWFNKENSAKVRPDENHVFDLSASFPGTVISIGFCLDPSYLSRIFNDA